MTDRKNRQATLVRRLRSRSAKEQCHSPSDMGIQRVLKSKTKRPLTTCCGASHYEVTEVERAVQKQLVILGTEV